MSKIILGLLLFLTTLLSRAEETKENWIQLFNGKNLNGWTPKIRGQELGINFKDTWRVEDGLLKVRYDQYETFDERFGHLFYEKPFSHYRLRIEYRFVGKQVKTGGGLEWAIRNNGVMFHCQAPKTMEVDQPFPVSAEFQLLGGLDEGERSTANLCTPGTHVVLKGELVTKHVINSGSKTYNGDQWVTLEYEVRGSGPIKHMAEGKVVLEYTDLQYDPKDEDAKKLIKDENDLLLKEGYIAIQAETAPIDIRKIELLELPQN